MMFVSLASFREVGWMDDPFARIYTPHEVRQRRIVNLQSVTNNVPPLWIDQSVVYQYPRATSESIADCDLGCFGLMRCFFKRGCATILNHDLYSLVERVEV